MAELLAGADGPVTPDRVGLPAAAISTTERAMLLTVWARYAGQPAGELAERVKAEPAVRAARPGQPLDLDAVAADCLAVAKKAGAALRVPLTDPAGYWQAEEEADLGGVSVPADEVFGAVPAGRR